MNNQTVKIRNARPEEFTNIGKLMFAVYSQLEGFPDETKLPAYYDLLLNVGDLTKKENTELLVATLNDNKVVGAVVYFSDLKNYGAHGVISKIKNASGFRLLAVNPEERGKGIGKLLSIACINKAKELKQNHLYIHSTESMKIAWRMYERLGFKRCTEIDFIKDDFKVYGFKISL